MKISRHRTAIARSKLSRPVVALRDGGWLDGSKTFFDYGCGRGDDVRLLSLQGVPATGWDPYWVPETTKTTADVVNLGFVVNVIEDPVERAEALREAYRLTRQMLAVSALIPAKRTAGTPYRDGWVTLANTFQRDFRPGELRALIVSTLGVAPVTMGPNLYFVPRGDAE